MLPLLPLFYDYFLRPKRMPDLGHLCQKFPKPPFQIYLLMQGEVFPKRTFIVTHVIIRESTVMLLTLEGNELPCVDGNVRIVEGFSVN